MVYVMRSLFPVFFASVALISTADAKSIQLDSKTTIKFSSVDKGREIIRTPDHFTRRLSSFDRMYRMRFKPATVEETFLQHIGHHVRNWSEDEKQKVSKSVSKFKKKVRRLSLNFPKNIYFVRTSGSETLGQAYTRHNAVFFSDAVLEQPQPLFDWILAHEFFHILSRNNPELREQLYAIVGFEKCNEIKLPESISKRKLTNPDAPINNYFIRVLVDGKKYLAIPLLLAKEDFNQEKHENQSMTDFAEFKLLLAEFEDEASKTLRAVHDKQGVVLIEPYRARGYFSKIGENTDYIIHPEEIMADNFVHMIMQSPSLATPEIPAKMESLFVNAAREKNAVISNGLVP